MYKKGSYKKGSYPKRISMLPEQAQDIWVSTFNSSIKNNSEETANKIAWSSVTKAGYTKKKDKWIKASEGFNYISMILEDTEELENLDDFEKPKESGDTENSNGSKFSEKLPSQIEIMRSGNWKHPEYGNFEITDSTMDNIITNFENRIRGIDIAFDLEHGETNHKSEAVCWVKNLVKQGSKLLAEVEWTKFGIEKIKDKGFRYFSPEFRFVYENAETGEKFRDVLLGGGLTNKPFIKNMNPILLSESVSKVYKAELNSSCILSEDFQKEEETLNKKLLETLKLNEKSTEDEISTAVNKLIEDSVKLSETEKKVKTLESEKIKLSEENTTLSKEVNDLKEKNIKLSETKTDSDKEIIKLNESINKINTQLKETEWESLYTVALNEGKMTPEMKDTFKAQYMVDSEATKKIIDCLRPIIKLNEETGTSGKSNEVSHFKLFETEVQKNMDTNKLNYAEALLRTKQEKPDLYKLVDAEMKGVN